MPDIPEPKEIPAPEPLPTPQQAPPPPPVPPVQPQQAAPVAPAPPPMPLSATQAPPPPVQVDGQSVQDQAIVKKRKSKRKELQQASTGTDALRIPLTKKLGATASGGTGSTGLNIPT